MLPPILSVRTILGEFKLGDIINEKEIEQFEYLKKDSEYNEGVYIYSTGLAIIGFVPVESIVILTYCRN